MKRGPRGDGKGAAGRARLASLGVALLAFTLLTAFAVVIFRGIAERDQLESRNDAERTMNLLLASLRDHDDFGSAIESVGSLRRKVVGVGVYAEGGIRIYSWGKTPETFTRTGAKGVCSWNNVKSAGAVSAWRPSASAAWAGRSSTARPKMPRRW